MRRAVPWLALFCLVAAACEAPSATPTDTCTPAGGTCVRTDAPMGAVTPAQSVCVDYGVWNESKPYDAREDLECPPHEDCSPKTLAFGIGAPSGGGNSCRSSKQVCCFARN